MVSNMAPEKKNLLYLYDLPKNEFTSVKLAEILKNAGIELELKPQVRRDPTKPFYSCIVCIKDDAQFKKASEVLRYFTIEGKQCRGLAFDPTLLGTNLTKTNEQCSIFVRKIPKDLGASALDDKFTNFDGSKQHTIKSLKISMDEDHTSRGYGFITYENPEDAALATKMLQESEENADCVAVAFKPKDRSDVRRIANNLYVKNYPESWTEEKLREVFAAFGQISMVKEMNHPNGKFAFICFMAVDPNDHEYGPKCAYAAINKLHGEVFEEKKLYVQPALNQAKRAEQKLRETIKYKNSKKRCNLYIKNIEHNSTEESLTEIFGRFGEIESIKIFPVEGPKAYAFVCFKTPDMAQQALQDLSKVPVNGRQLSICHYELAEYRAIADEETKDKLGFQRFKQMNYSSNQWNEISSRDEFYFKITELLRTLPFQQRMGVMGGQQQQRQGPGGFRNNNQQGYNNQRRGNSQGDSRMPYNAQAKQHSGYNNNQGGQMRPQYNQAPMSQPPPSAVSAMPPPMMQQPQAAQAHMGQNPNMSQTE